MNTALTVITSLTAGGMTGAAGTVLLLGLASRRGRNEILPRPAATTADATTFVVTDEEATG